MGWIKKIRNRPPTQKKIIADGLRWSLTYQRSELWRDNTWLGVPFWQHPHDVLVLQSILHETKPDYVIETGVAHGGSAIFYASMLQLLGGKGVISVDINIPEEIARRVREHPLGKQVTLIEGDSVSESVLRKINAIVGEKSNAVVCLDSDHHTDHVLAELHAYGKYVPRHGYMIALDTICKWLPRWKNNNPLIAVEKFLAAQKDFVRASRCGTLDSSFMPYGILIRQSGK
ncbi:MAG: CmcI family methyltransferase [Candidatus Binatia bacterium]